MTTKKEEKQTAVPVDGDITPISKIPVPQVDSTDWNNISISNLIDQKNTLTNRYYALLQHGGTPDILKQIQFGIARIEAILEQKTTDGVKLLWIPTN